MLVSDLDLSAELPFGRRRAVSCNIADAQIKSSDAQYYVQIVLGKFVLTFNSISMNFKHSPMAALNVLISDYSAQAPKTKMP